jgi:hypothetical protein
VLDLQSLRRLAKELEGEYDELKKKYKEAMAKREKAKKLKYLKMVKMYRENNKELKEKISYIENLHSDGSD